MTPSCTIIISHYESIPFLRACIRQIRKYAHPEIKQHIIISDQSSQSTYINVFLDFGNSPDITIVHSAPLYSGYGLDYIFRNFPIHSEYVCQLHVDAFPIHKNWLFMSLGLMEEFDFKYVGVLQFICDKPEAIYYYKNNFFAMAHSFNIGRTDVYEEMALEGGFTRFHNRPQDNSGMVWKNNDWAEWAKEDYQKRGSDDDTVAFDWEDNHREHDKLGFGITGKMGIHGEESGTFQRQN